jgi:hypothetical protein
VRLGTSRISGLRVGEVELDLISHADAIVRVRFAYVREDGATAGSFNKNGGWSEATQAALQRFVEALEADGFRETFQGEAGPPEDGEEPAPTDEVKQF